MTTISPLRSFLRANRALLQGRLHFPRQRINTTIIDENGVALTIFREMRLGDVIPPESATFHVRFHVAGMPPRINKLFSWLTIPFFAGLPGFRHKLWLINETTGDFHGIYRWDTVADAERYADSFAMRFMAGRSVPGSAAHSIEEGIAGK